MTTTTKREVAECVFCGSEIGPKDVMHCDDRDFFLSAKFVDKEKERNSLIARLRRNRRA